ncbi:MAG: type II secretion system protein [Patescibacteria group bacterium]
MQKNRFQGFTLIELLVVIAIIGILSAVVLASLNTARSKGNDAAIQSDLSTIQTQAEIYYGTWNNAYGGNGATVLNVTGTAATGNSCIAGTALPTMFGSDTNIKNALIAADIANTTNSVVVCNMAANGTQYAVSSPLASNATSYWCVDSTGFSGGRTTALGNNTQCPST